MLPIVHAAITVLTVMIMCILALCGYAPARAEYDGGASSTGMSTGQIMSNPPGQTPTVAQFAALQSKFLMPGPAAEYNRLFSAVYRGVNAPAVITLDDIKHSLPYSPAKMFMPTIHIGQRKLFLTELQFLVDKAPTKQIICIYAGAAPSHHTGFLAALFPHVKFILVDPNPFEVFGANPVVLTSEAGDARARAAEMMQAAVAGSAQIYIVNDLMTMELAAAAHDAIPHDQLYFVSDIRTNTSEDNTGPTTLDILWNLSQQYNWMSVMRPAWSMLKFRHPFYDNDALFNHKQGLAPYAADFAKSKEFGIDFVANHSAKTLTYWDGAVNLQAFPGSTSAETRLITDCSTIRDWGGPADYEAKLFYYNTIERGFRHHENDNASRADGFDHCNDCAIENHLWKQYIKEVVGSVGPVGAVGPVGSVDPKVGATTKYSNYTVIDYVRKLSVVTYRRLLRDSHGRLFGPYPLKIGIQRVEHVRTTSHPRRHMTGVPIR